jgi:hypothetical protein
MLAIQFERAANVAEMKWTTAICNNKNMRGRRFQIAQDSPAMMPFEDVGSGLCDHDPKGNHSQ